MCHGTIHRLIPDEKELGKRYCTRELLLSHPTLAGYVQWKRKKAGKGIAGIKEPASE
jgi:hypothetical protein